MKVIVNPQPLANALRSISLAVKGRTPAPILQSVRLTAKDGILKLFVTNQEQSVQVSVGQSDVLEDGESVIPHQQFMELASQSDSPTVTLQSNEQHLEFIGKNHKFKLSGFNVSDAPSCDVFDEKVTGECSAKTFAVYARKALPCAAVEHSRYAISGLLLCIDGKGQMRVVSTDGRRLVLCGNKLREDAKSYILPVSAVKLILTLLDDEEEFSISGGSSDLVASIGIHTKIRTTLVEGTFPPFEDIIPKQSTTKALVARDELLKAIRLSNVTREDLDAGAGTRFDFNGALVISNRDKVIGEGSVECELASLEGDPISIGLRSGYITDFVKAAQADQIKIELTAPNKPCVLFDEDGSLCVIMPVNLQ